MIATKSVLYEISLRTSLQVVVGIVLASCSLQKYSEAAAIWGSFDASRINYSGGALSTGSEHSILRGIISGGGNTIAPGTTTLTNAYLSGVDVFYTSLLSTTTGTLSAPEQAALQSWVASGGTLIVTADIFPLAAYESFTSVYGVTGYTAESTTGIGTIIASHPTTTGASNFSYATDSTYFTAANALILGENINGDDFMAVLEPATGFNIGGRLLVFGDHNMFSNGFIGNSDNTLLATNMVQWAMSPFAIPEPSTFVLASIGLLGMCFRRRKQA